MAKTSSNLTTMEELLASQKQKPLNLLRGQQVEGEIVTISEKELILDLGAKSEGIIPIRDISKDTLKSLKIGDKFKAFVLQTENEFGQIVLSTHPQSPRTSPRRPKSKSWDKLIQAQNLNTQLKGKVLEQNMGGLLVEIFDLRGFLPNSQVGYNLLAKFGESQNLIGIEISVSVIEVNPAENRLVLSQRGQVPQEIKSKLEAFKKGVAIKGKVLATLPFGLVLAVGDIVGLVFISDVSWEKVEDLSKFSPGLEIEAQVLNSDLDFGRLSLSIKQLSEDPFQKISEKFGADQVVKGEVTQITNDGVVVNLDGTEGFLPVSKMGETAYEAGQTVSFLVDSVDTRRRRINLAPFVTTTEGLIYK